MSSKTLRKIIRNPIKNILLWVGQSNATGNGGHATYMNTLPNGVGLTENVPVSIVPLDFCTTSNPGVIPGIRDNAPPATPVTLLPFVPIVEGRDTFDGSAGELDIHGESSATACIKFLYERTKGKFIAINTARDGAAYQTGTAPQHKGGNPYAWSQLAVRGANSQYGPNAVVMAICNVHGEADAVNGAAKTTITSDTALPAATLNCAAFTVGTTIGTQFVNGAGNLLAETTAGIQLLTYTGCTSGQFTGVSGGTGTIQAGGNIYRADYANYLATWIANYQTDLQAITGQNTSLYPIQMYICQQVFYSTTNVTDTGRTALLDYAAWKASLSTTPNPLILVGARYMLPGSTVGGGALHIGIGGLRWWGEMYGKVIWRTKFLGQQWLPLYPTNVARSGAVITITFNVPSGSLTYDARLVKWVANWGFSYTDSGGTITISSVAIASSNTVTITLSGDPSANTNKFIQYGWNTMTLNAGTMGQVRGNLRDTDPEQSSYGYPLYNWCVIFEESVP